ncbi:MAG: serine/threonine-protein phosphatase [Burkholderiaceae bacterium]|nr:serine/threonine-protein phosphatase [Burkholderiaceae bacterium]
MRFDVYQVSRKGGRPKNEDRMGYCYTRSSGLFALADGMGGHPEGEVAAQLALQTLAALFQRDAKPALKDPVRFLHDAVLAGHHRLLRYATERGLIDTPRTTIVACVLQDQAAHWVHCGDSRLYLMRDNKLVSRTRDHSYTELQDALQQSGQALPADPQRFNRNVLFTCLGSPGKPVVDTAGPVMLQPRDRVMLCSDGLWGSVSDELIARLLAKRPIADAVPELAEQALRNGGSHSDNVTVLAVEFEGAGETLNPPVVSTRTLGEEVFASTIQASLAGSDAPVEAQDAALDEAEIERSIREINEAIKRSSQKGP